MSQKVEPMLLTAVDLAPSDLGVFEWDSAHNADYLTVSNGNKTIEWAKRHAAAPAGPSETATLPPAWIPASTRSHLHSGTFQWDFVIEEMASAQIGIGFMLLWNVGPDWGFFGYLGSSHSAWSYDPSTGDVVYATESIQGGLPRFENGRTGVVSVHLDLPREAKGSARFSVGGVESRPLGLSAGAVVMPAACFLAGTQKVTLANFQKHG